MFAIEITFKDGVSQPEMIFVRRPYAVIGASETAHVSVDDMKGLGYQLSLSRDLRRKFKCKPIGMREGMQVPSVLEGMYDGQATIDVGAVRFHVIALDSDLRLREAEPPDRAGVRVLRQACAAAAPSFPAVMVRGAQPVVVSFAPDQPVFIGRSNQCAVRLDQADISAKHARMGFESGQFWIEDLGSTNGTFVAGQQISGRVNVAPGAPITLGREVSIVGVMSESEMSGPSRRSETGDRAALVTMNYPALVAVSEVARPARVVLSAGSEITIGRVPSSDLWLGAPHISRKHCSVRLTKTGALTITDHSTNGTAYDDGLLRAGESSTITAPKVLDFGSGVTVGICFDPDQERAFIAASGAAGVFSGQPAEAVTTDATAASVVRRRQSRTGTFRPETFVGLSPGLKAKVMFLSLSLPERLLVMVVFSALPVILGALLLLIFQIGR